MENGVGWSATLVVPERSDPLSMFIVEVKLDPEDSDSNRVSYNPSKIQFAGAVEPTPDIQNPADGLVEFLAKPIGERKYSLKFMALSNATQAEVVLEFGKNSTRRTVRFFTVEKEKNYHLHVLIIALILIFIAWKTWAFQSKNQNLMSTRSLFMSFEELEKFQKEHFPDSEAPSISTSPLSEPAPNGISAKEEKVKRSGEIGKDTLKLDIPEIPSKIPDSNELQEPASEPSEAFEKPLPSVSSRTEEVPIVPIPPPQVEKIEGQISIPDEGFVQTVRRDSARVKAQIEIEKFPERLEKAPSEKRIFLRLVDESSKAHEGIDIEITIGRHKGNVICLTQAEVSRNHAIVKSQEDKLVIVPLAKNNRTELNGNNVTDVAFINQGDTLSLGGTHFKIECLEIRESLG
ncbi:FHA domain-containing protein [bacterium]|nr:FHA domain-containing protein [bacterium]